MNYSQLQPIENTSLIIFLAGKIYDGNKKLIRGKKVLSGIEYKLNDFEFLLNTSLHFFATPDDLKKIQLAFNEEFKSVRNKLEGKLK